MASPRPRSCRRRRRGGRPPRGRRPQDEQRRPEGRRRPHRMDGQAYPGRVAVSTGDLLAAALDYVERGWPVFPCRPGDKVPLAELAPHGLKEATCDPDVVRGGGSAVPGRTSASPPGTRSTHSTSTGPTLSHFSSWLAMPMVTTSRARPSRHRGAGTATSPRPGWATRSTSSPASTGVASGATWSPLLHVGRPGAIRGSLEGSRTKGPTPSSWRRRRGWHACTRLGGRPGHRGRVDRLATSPPRTTAALH